MKQTAYLLDPDTTIFRAFELPDGISFKPIHDLIGCRLIELVRFDERHSLFVDEEGLRDGLTAFTIFEGYPQPLAGKIVCESACRRSRVSFGSRLTRDLDVPSGGGVGTARAIARAYRVFATNGRELQLRP
ncbi:MAG: hypothetical protein E5W70_20280 [Mesorhizobium sp.]|uniref:DUF3846 domain-containing protein n=1 Tax=Mesorhizobium sp. TaxID=1871066 RepID=UPI0011FA93F3|nr:hypothetical protein [Mesorhizobium sp.]TIT20686.1 MAG: hypothetical protein E5W70_20280 [Mesorhizobium sp.]